MIGAQCLFATANWTEMLPVKLFYPVLAIKYSRPHTAVGLSELRSRGNAVFLQFDAIVYRKQYFRSAL
jgi:hypothetical protein